MFVYDKQDNQANRTSRLDMKHTIFVNKDRTADYQMTRRILEILDHDGNVDDLVAFMLDKDLPVDDIEATRIAEALLRERPKQGYLTVSNARQWRLQYRRAITQAGSVDGLLRVR